MRGLRWMPWLLLGASMSATAAEAPTMQGCALLKDDQARLRCFDTVSGRLPTEVTPVPEGPRGAGGGALESAIDRVTEPVREPPSLLTRQWQLIAQTDRGPFVITPYRPTYLLALSYNFQPNEAPFDTQIGEPGAMDPAEVKFQISFKTKIWPDPFSRKNDLWFGYTQVAYWQAYNWDVSAPFRETNHEPEFIFSRRVDRRLGGLNIRVLTASFNHQSNGRSEPLSRSWNRLIGGVLLDRGTDFALSMRAWWRIPESDDEDDNPDIEDYVGRGELWLHYRRAEQTYSVMVRNNLRLDDNRSAVQVDWTRPIGSSPFQGYVQYFWGYGDGLIDYDHISHRLSIGVMLYGWL